MSARVSILIPCFNAAGYVAAALESALAQSVRPLEIIVVDDGSTDASGEVLKAYEERGVKVLRTENRGQCAAANLAFRESSGDYLKFFDADDVLAPDHLERQLSRLDGSQVDIAMGEWARFYADDPLEAVFEPLAMYRDSDPVSWLASEWLDAKPMMQCGLWLIPRPVLERSGLWDERLSLINDFEFFTRVLLSARRILFTPGARLFYRTGVPNSLSSQKSRKAVESAFLSISLAADRLLADETSSRTRLACANVLKYFDYSYYPDHHDLRLLARTRVAALGGATVLPDGPPRFHSLRKLIGWRLARHAQLAFGTKPNRALE